MLVVFVGFVDFDDGRMIELFEDHDLVNETLTVLDLFLADDLNCADLVRKVVASCLIHGPKGAFSEDL